MHRRSNDWRGSRGLQQSSLPSRRSIVKSSCLHFLHCFLRRPPICLFAPQVACGFRAQALLSYQDAPPAAARPGREQAGHPPTSQKVAPILTHTPRHNGARGTGTQNPSTAAWQTNIEHSCMIVETWQHGTWNDRGRSSFRRNVNTGGCSVAP